MPYISVRYERVKLYEEVWAEPVTKVAERYGISDVALRRICRKLAVPLPPLGYWAKRAAGIGPQIPSLPRHAGPAEIVRDRFISDDALEPEPEHLVARRDYEARPENRITVAETLDRPHPLVAATERAFMRATHLDLRNLPTTGRRALDVSVSKASLPRVLRIMDALAKALEARGFPLRIDRDGKRCSYVMIQGEKIAVRLVEATLRTERMPTAKEREERKKSGFLYLPNRYSYQPTGSLKLGIVGSYGNELQTVVADGKQQRIEQRINDFIVKLEAEAAHRKRQAERRAHEKQLWEEQARRQHEREERKREEFARLTLLEEQAGKWRRAERIRAYVAAVEAKAVGERGEIGLGSGLSQWIVWARRKADEIDPLVEDTSSVRDIADALD